MCPTHITIDIKRIEANKLNDTDFIKRYMSVVCSVFDLRPIGYPNICKFPSPGGITASQVLGASLIDVHTYPEHGVIYISVFSCGNFDTIGLFNYSKNFFGSQWGYLCNVKRLSLTEV